MNDSFKMNDSVKKMNDSILLTRKESFTKKNHWSIGSLEFRRSNLERVKKFRKERVNESFGYGSMEMRIISNIALFSI